MDWFRVPLENLLILPNVPAGCNLLRLMILVDFYRNSTNDTTEVLVVPEKNHNYRITDGRHRFLASVIAGRHDLLCTLDKKEMERLDALRSSSD